MIRARKEEASISNTLQQQQQQQHQQQQSDGAFSGADHHQQQTRRPLGPHHGGNVMTNAGIIGGIISSNNVNTLPVMNNNAGIHNNTNSTATNVSAFVASALSASASSIHHFHNFKQLQRRKSKMSSPSTTPSSHQWDGKGSTGHWTVQMPKRMMVSTLGIFLIFPLLIFVWKETHLAKSVPDVAANARQVGDNNHFVRGNHNPLASWVADHLPADATSLLSRNETNVEGLKDGNERSSNGDGSNFLPEPISIPNSKGTEEEGGILITDNGNKRNETTLLDDDDGGTNEAILLEP